MNKVIVILSLMFSISSFAKVTQMVCKHFAGTKVMSKISVYYLQNSETRQWAEYADVEVKSSRMNLFPSGWKKAKLVGNIKNLAAPLAASVEFTPTRGQDYDHAKLSFLYDDNLGQVATVEYVSDGPTHVQFMQCEYNE